MNKILFAIAILITFSFTFKNKKFKGPEGFVFIPSGTVTVDSDSKYSCAAFWMSDHEVTNKEYRDFLKSLKKSGKTGEFENALPDTLQWLKVEGDLDAMANTYFWHPAYDNYPVVNISKEGVQEYCEYITQKYRAIYGDVIQDFRLPTRMEWMYAASSGKSNQIYPWGGSKLRNEKGEFLANFRPIGDQNITMSESGPVVVSDSLFTSELFLDGGFYTVEVQSYEPNDFGLYNMSGNVAEMVAKEDIVVGGSWYSPGYDIRIQSKKSFDGPSPFVGFRPVMSYLAPEK